MKRMSIPMHLIPSKMTIPEHEEFLNECVKLRDELIAEYSSAEFVTKPHGSHRTYIDGCTGPFCTQTHRVYTRLKRGGDASDYWKTYDPIVESMAAQISKEIAEAVERARIDTFRSLGKTDFIHTT